MSENKKKIFPKIQKKIKSFLTDESGKISKKDALGLSVGVMLLSGVEEVGAYPWSWHLNENLNLWDAWHANIRPGLSNNQYCSTVNVNHASWIVNWHYSATPAYNWWTLWWHGQWIMAWHASHGSHGSHCSGKSCW